MHTRAHARGSLRAACAAGWVLILGAALARAAEPALEARLDRARAEIGSQVVLSLTLQGFSQRAGAPQIPPLDALEIYDSGRTTSVSFVNGKLSSSMSYTFVLVPRQAGTLSIGPITVEDKGKVYRAEPLELTVVPASSSRAPVPAGRAPAGTAPAPSARGDGQQQGLFARVEIDQREAFVDEQLVLHFRLYQREDVQLIDIGGFEPPSAEGFWREDLGPQRDYSVQLNGAGYHVREVSWALFPTQAGELEIGPASIVAYVPGRSRGRGFFDDFFGPGGFDRRAVTLQTDPLQVHVRPLPEGGRPAGFTGSVGDYRIAATCEPQQARQNEPVTLTVSVSGAGHVQTIGAPVWPQWDGLRVFDSGEAVSLEKREDRVEGKKDFTQVLIPTRAGHARIAPIRFVYFDPAKRRYEAIATEPLEIEVAAGGSPASGSWGDAVVPLGQDILYIHTDLAQELRPTQAGGAAGAWVIHLTPLAALGAAALLRRRRLAFERNPILARRSRALREARRALATHAPGMPIERLAALLSETLERYLSAWLDLPVRGTLRAELRSALGEKGLEAGLIERVLDLLNRSEEIRFGCGGAGCNAAELVSDLGRLLDALEIGFRMAGQMGRAGGAAR